MSIVVVDTGAQSNDASWIVWKIAHSALVLTLTAFQVLGGIGGFFATCCFAASWKKRNDNYLHKEISEAQGVGKTR